MLAVVTIDDQQVDAAVFLPALGGGGLERMRLNLVTGLRADGLTVDVVVGLMQGPHVGSLPQDVNILNLHAGRMTQALVPLARYLREKRPRVLLTGLDYANVAALALSSVARLHHTRIVVSVHKPFGLAVSHSALRRDRWLLPHLVRALYPRAYAVVAVSQGVANDLAVVARMERSRIRVIYNPVITDDFARRADDPVDHKWFRTSTVPVIVAAGRLHPEKDYPTMLRGFALARAHRDLRLIILGDGAERSSLEHYASALGIREDVEFAGFVMNPLPFMREAALFVTSSTWEGFGNVIVEALACGTPVVSTDCPTGPREILESGKHGTLVPVGNPGAFATAILSALLEQRTAADLKARGQVFGVKPAVAQYRAAMGVEHGRWRELSTRLRIQSRLSRHAAGVLLELWTLGCRGSPM